MCIVQLRNPPNKVELYLYIYVLSDMLISMLLDLKYT